MYSFITWTIVILCDILRSIAIFIRLLTKSKYNRFYFNLPLKALMKLENLKTKIRIIDTTSTSTWLLHSTPEDDYLQCALNNNNVIK